MKGYFGFHDLSCLLVDKKVKKAGKYRLIKRYWDVIRYK